MSLPHLDGWRWAFAIVGAFGLGISKTGIAGIGILMIALFTMAFPGKLSIGAVLPLLLVSDVVAVASYRRHADWRYLWALLPCACVGVIAGWQALGKIPNSVVSPGIGGVLIVLVLVQFWRRWRIATNPDVEESGKTPVAVWFMISVGIVAGFTTMVANAAGPIMILYLLAARLPKMEFIGTGAWFYLIINMVKVPFSIQVGAISPVSCAIDAVLIPFSIAGAFAGRRILGRIDQGIFESIALALTLVAAVRLVVT